MGERPGTGQLPSDRPSPGDGTVSDNRADRVDNRQDTQAGRQDARTDRQDTRTDNRTDRRDTVSNNRADRIDNIDQRKVDRYERHQQIRDQYKSNHPRAAFWADNPYWARWRWNRPYRWATWAVLGSWFPWGWTSAASYSYGDNIYYEGDTVYYGEEAVATSEEYATQAQTIAESAPQATDAEEWMSLGVFALVQDGEPSGPPPSLFLQLAVSKQGILSGTFHNSETEQTEVVEGAVDGQTQRSAWGIAGKDWPIMETGISSLTTDTAPALLHFADGQTQQWLMVRLEDPEGEAAQ